MKIDPGELSTSELEMAISLNVNFAGMDKFIPDSPRDIFFETHEINEISMFFFGIDLNELWKNCFN